MIAWDAEWQCAFDALAALSANDLARSVTVRGEVHSVALATERSLARTAYHVGQIVLLARHWAGEQWTTLTIARGGSETYNRAAWSGDDYQRRAGEGK
jgi:hypothetical protein